MLSMWQFMFLNLLFLGSLFSISSNSWFSAWVGLEVNLLALLPLLMNNQNPRESEAALKYFITQALSSVILISSALTFTPWNSAPSFLFSTLIAISLLIKIGAAPFHFWVPPVVEGTSWLNNILLLTWQKVAPFLLLPSTLSSFSSPILKTSICLSAVLGAIGGLNQTSLRKIMSFSSINHSGWMIQAILISKSMWTLYVSIYFSMLIPLMMFFHSYSLNLIHQSYFNTMSKMKKLTIFIPLISLGGLPPFLGFLPKWMIVSSLFPLNPMTTIILIMSSAISLFFYIQMSFGAILVNSASPKIPLMQQMSSLEPFLIMMNLSGILIIPLIFSLFY